MKKTTSQITTVINKFRGPYAFLSNFSPSFIIVEGLAYPTVEHAYQASKTTELSEKLEIRNAETPGQAKKLGKSVTLRPNWEEIKVSVMENLLRLKFQDRTLRNKLLSTGTATLVEGNGWGDTFWGVDIKKNAGENHLGKLLMRIRAEISNGRSLDAKD